MKTKRYEITLTGMSPLLMHRDNLNFGEYIKRWSKDPDNKAQSVAGDDRSPAWTWIGYVYHDDLVLGIDADNLMTMLREGGAKVPVGKGKETFKKQTQSGIVVDGLVWPISVKGRPVPMLDVQALIGNPNFQEHLETAEMLGFELFVKRAKINNAKHVRVRPMFCGWTASGTVTVLDEELSGITEAVLKKILEQAGSLCGLCDWRPSSPSKSGTYGRFIASVDPI